MPDGPDNPPLDGTQQRTPDVVQRQESDARERRPEEPAPLPATIGKYEIRVLVGEGAFGRVLRGFDPGLEREVAIKVPRAGLTNERREEFLREARAAAQIKHPFICEIYEVGQDGSVPFIVMPLVESTLAKRMAQSPPLSLRESLTIARDVAMGLHAAHRKGIVHRDMKPANILYDENEERVLITDFGLAKLIDSTMTLSTGGTPEVKGTPTYMSPEQWQPDPRNPVGPASDVYSLGVILFQLLTGIPPFACPDGNLFALGYAVVNSEPRKPSAIRPGLDPRLDTLCLKALEKVPIDRYPSANAFADAISELLRTGGEPAPQAATVARADSANTTPHPQAEADYQRGEEYYDARGGVPQDYGKAREWWEKAAARGHARAQYQLGHLYDNGRGVPQDYAKAREWYEKAAAQGHAAAQFCLGRFYHNGLGVSRDFAKAREWLEKAAAQGLADAECNLGYMYDHAEGVERDYVKAREWYEKAVAQGDGIAQINLGVMYQEGRGVPLNYLKARELFEKAAAQGIALGQYNLGVLYQNGWGTPKDFVKALEWYEKAAAQGSTDAQVNLGYMYDEGLGVWPDSAKAREWFEMAAASGDAVAQFGLGTLYVHGRGVRKDFGEARWWWEKAAAQGYADAQHSLGLLYDKGDGVKQDYVKAREWYAQAAAQGHSAAQALLGNLYELGRGGPKNLTRAKELYRQAAEGGYKEAKAALERLKNRD
jgi:TPR repeat protein